MAHKETIKIILGDWSDDGHKDELLLGYDASRNEKPWFVVADNDPLDVLTYGATAIKALLTYARQGKSTR